MSIGTFEALFCTLFFVLSGYITHEVIGLIYPINNDEISATKQVLQYLMYSVINLMLFLPAIVWLSKALLSGPDVFEVVDAILNAKTESLNLFVWLWVMPNSGLFCFLSILIVVTGSVLTGIVWGKIEKKYSEKKSGLVKGMSSWDKLFYDENQTYVFLRLKTGECIYGLWGRAPSRVDASFVPNPAIVIEQCNDEFTPLGSFIWIDKENIALMQIVRSEVNERKKD